MSTNSNISRKYSFLVKATLSFLLISMTTSCQPSTLATPTAPSPLETMTMTPAPTATPTLIYQPNPISFADQGEWNFSHPYVFEDWPDLIIPDGDVYKLDESYEIQSVELSYQWWGLGDPVFNYQQIKKSGSSYMLGGKIVSEEKVKNLVNSMNNLHIVPQTLSSITHTDDYPIWAIEITGNDDTKILLNSTSNSASYVPWNVIYNGEIYAQFDGSVAIVLADLFAVSEGEPMAAFFPGGGEEGELV